MTKIGCGPYHFDTLNSGVKYGKGLIFVGDCLRKHRGRGIFVQGCPSHDQDALWAIVDRRSYESPENMDFDINIRMAEEDKIFKDYMKKPRDNTAR